MPIPALDRPERQLGCDEERRRHQRCTRVDCARAQTEKDGVGRTDSDESPGHNRDPTAHEGKHGNKDPDSAECGHERNQPVAGERGVRADGAEERERCEPGTYTRAVLA
jgi:hypothetical protein